MKFIRYHGFQSMSAEELYEILKLRQDIFIIEQDCIYDDIDGLDKQSNHLLLKKNDDLVAYSRIVPAEVKYDEPSVGRIVVNIKFRGQGFGKQIIRESLKWVIKEGAESVRIEAQAHLTKFYESLGFTTAGEIYDLDGIPHVQMTQRLDQ